VRGDARTRRPPFREAPGLEFPLVRVQQGQCGACMHFGHGADSPQLVQIRVHGEAPEDYTDACGRPELSAMELRVSAISGCAGFEPAQG